MIIITFPISKLLDKIVGKEIGFIYNSKQLKKLVELNYNAGIDIESRVHNFMRFSSALDSEPVSAIESRIMVSDLIFSIL